MKILITGGVGHLGSNISIEAMKRGHTVIAMDNLHREEVINNLKYLQDNFHRFVFVWGDVRNHDDFDRIPKVDAIIHLAANPGVPWSIKWPTYDFDTNARGTLNALQFARKLGNIPFIYASTNKTFSDIINIIPMIEKDKRYEWDIKLFNNLPSFINATIDYPKTAIRADFPVMGFGKYGHSMYGISKLCGELYATEYHVQYGLPVVINKMSCIYGLFQKGCPDQGWVSSFLLDIGFRDKPITFYGNGKQVRDVLDARDVARLYIDELEHMSKANGEVFTVGGGYENTVSLIETVEEIERQTGKKAVISYERKRDADQDIYISSINKVKEVMEWEPKIKFKDTIADMIKEYSE